MGPFVCSKCMLFVYGVHCNIRISIWIICTYELNSFKFPIGLWNYSSWKMLKTAYWYIYKSVDCLRLMAYSITYLQRRIPFHQIMKHIMGGPSGKTLVNSMYGIHFLSMEWVSESVSPNSCSFKLRFLIKISLRFILTYGIKFKRLKIVRLSKIAQKESILTLFNTVDREY